MKASLTYFTLIFGSFLFLSVIYVLLVPIQNIVFSSSNVSLQKNKIVLDIDRVNTHTPQSNSRDEQNDNKPFRKEVDVFHSLESQIDLTLRCNDYFSPETLRMDRFYYYKNPKTQKELLWCKVPKVGSTMMSNKLLRSVSEYLSSKQQEDTSVHSSSPDVHVLLRRHYPQLTVEQLSAIVAKNTTMKLIMVRDPFERILSAYRDKLEHNDARPGDNLHYDEIGKQMMTSQAQVNASSGPTWEEFISYLLRTDVSSYDVHWSPISQLCAPCLLKYNNILPLHEFDVKSKYLFMGILPEPDMVIASESEQEQLPHYTGSSNTFTIKEYYQRLSVETVWKLYLRYKDDFHLFGFNAFKYFYLN